MLRERLAWCSFPILMGGFVALAAWGLAQGIERERWAIALTIANFFVILAVEQVLPRNPRMQVWGDAQAKNDVGHGILLAAIARPVGGAVSLLVMTRLAEARGLAELATLWPAQLVFPLQFGIAWLMFTFSDYWIHRSLHSFDRLWWFHSIHHDTPSMHILKSGRLHFGEEVFNAVLKPLPLLLLGAPPEIFWWLGIWIVFDGNLVHSNIDQRFPTWAHYILPTVQLHNLHHARDRRHQDSNFSGSTALWDALFGTLSHPGRCPLGELGIERSPVPSGFFAQVIFPFRAQWKPPR